MNFRILTTHVTSDVLEGEAVIVNLQSGAYFSAAGAGGLVWKILTHGASFEHIVSTIRSGLSLDLVSLENDVQKFLETLTNEGLIEQGTFPVENCSIEPQYFNFEYGGMELQRYEDMQDLLALDPIHEVEERGWPFPNEQ